MNNSDNNIKISIIMPVFNASRYVGSAIESIITQSFEGFELILVDDGSSDGSEDICRKYANEYDNIVYLREENNGICAARNTGLKLAKGQYIGFADHDDEYSNLYLARMYDKASKCKQAEMIRCGVSFIEEFSNGKLIDRKEMMPDGIILIKELVSKLTSLPSSYFTVWNCIYKREFLNKNQLFFSENIKYGNEDYNFTIKAMMLATQICFISECLYVHYRRVNQSMSACFNKDIINCTVENYYLEKKLTDAYIKNEEVRNVNYWILYMRKITGLMFYCFRACDNAEFYCIELLEKFDNMIKVYNFNLMLNIKTFFRICRKSFKYGLLVFFVYFKRWDFIVFIYEKKYYLKLIMAKRIER